MFKKILFLTKFDEFALPILRGISCFKNEGWDQVILLHVADIEKL